MSKRKEYDDEFEPVPPLETPPVEEPPAEGVRRTDPPPPPAMDAPVPPQHLPKPDADVEKQPDADVEKKGEE
jgi:hypothetical protein